jgi:hypothetical protein
MAEVAHARRAFLRACRRHGGRRWTHEFAMRVFADDAELEAALAAEHLRLERWLDLERGWFVATAAPARA